MLMLVLPSAHPPIRPSAQDPAPILDRASASFDTVRTLQADFVQIVDNPMVGDPDTTRGKLFQRRPSYFAMRFTDPNNEPVGPTVIDHVKPDMSVATEEIFGPVISIIRTGTLDEEIKIENENPYGNAASVFTQSGGLARYVMEHASAGMIGVNIGVPVPREPFSFGGWNESKFGVGDITGRGSIEFWTKSKKMTTKWNKEAGVNWMS